MRNGAVLAWADLSAAAASENLDILVVLVTCSPYSLTRCSSCCLCDLTPWPGSRSLQLWPQYLLSPKVPKGLRKSCICRSCPNSKLRSRLSRKPRQHWRSLESHQGRTITIGPPKILETSNVFCSNALAAWRHAWAG